MNCRAELAGADMQQMEAWSTTHSILQSSDAAVEAKLFAATTLKGKVGVREASHFTQAADRE